MYAWLVLILVRRLVSFFRLVVSCSFAGLLGVFGFECLIGWVLARFFFGACFFETSIVDDGNANTEPTPSSLHF